MMRALLKLITSKLGESNTYYDKDGISPYLTRWYLLGDRPDPDEMLKGQNKEGVRDSTFNLFIHCFHRSDSDHELHSHPWAWGVSLVLAGGYREERREGDRVVTKDVRPFTINALTGDTYHRVELFEDDAWTLFVVGPKVSTWYFWDRHKLACAKWRDFLNARRAGFEPAWEPDRREPIIGGAA